VGGKNKIRSQELSFTKKDGRMKTGSPSEPEKKREKGEMITYLVDYETGKQAKRWRCEERPEVILHFQGERGRERDDISV